MTRLSAAQAAELLARAGLKAPAAAGSAQQRYRALGRLKPGEMNKTEQAYREYLEGEKHAGRVLAYWFEGVTLKLGPDCRFTADFLVLFADRELELVDVKGARAVATDDSRVKARVAAGNFPFRVRAAYPRKKADGGGFEHEEF